MEWNVYSTLFHSVPSWLVSSHPIPSYPILLYSTLERNKFPPSFQGFIDLTSSGASFIPMSRKCRILQVPFQHLKDLGDANSPAGMFLAIMSFPDIVKTSQTMLRQSKSSALRAHQLWGTENTALKDYMTSFAPTNFPGMHVILYHTYLPKSGCMASICSMEVSPPGMKYPHMRSAIAACSNIQCNGLLWILIRADGGLRNRIPLSIISRSGRLEPSWLKSSHRFR